VSIIAARQSRRSLRGEPGLAVASDGAQGQNPVIRGLKKESVVLLVDGMRVNSAQPQGAIASFMTLGLADRVEVVKGPASVLYGTGALGGAINVLLPQARFEPGVGAEAGAGFDSASSGLRGTGVMNASQGDHALMLGASVARIGDYSSPTGTWPAPATTRDALHRPIPLSHRCRTAVARVAAAAHRQGCLVSRFDQAHPPGRGRQHHRAFAATGTPLAEIGYSRKGSGASRR
jgi:hemoglobin/transferrin/lactoferrin receptor protein